MKTDLKDRITLLPEIIAILNNERIAKEIACLKKNAAAEKNRGVPKITLMDNLEASIKERLDYMLTLLGTSLKELTLKTKLPQDTMEEFFTIYFTKKVFYT